MKETYEVPKMTLVSTEVEANCLTDALHSYNWAGTNERRDVDEMETDSIGKKEYWHFEW